MKSQHTRIYSETSTLSSSDYCVTSEYNGERNNVVEDVPECNIMEITNVTNDIKSSDVTNIDLDLDQYLQNERPQNIANQRAEVRTMKHNEYIHLTRRHSDEKEPKKNFINRGIIYGRK